MQNGWGKHRVRYCATKEEREELWSLSTTLPLSATWPPNLKPNHLPNIMKITDPSPEIALAVSLWLDS